MAKLILPLLLALFTLSAPYLAAQDNQKLRLAQSYEESGDYDNASRLYLELYEGDKNSQAYFDGTRRTLLSQNKFSVLLPLVEERLQKRATPDLYSLLGNLHWKMGKTSAADEAWSKAMSIAPNEATTYVAVAQAQIDNRLFDKAIVTLQEGRDELNQPTLFANEMSQLYGTVNKFKEGTAEVISYLRQSKNMAVAQGRISAYLISEQGIAETRKVMDETIRNNSSDMLLLQLYSWFLREVKDYDKALEVYTTIDNLAGSNGREILAFADLARREGYYEPAMRAYSVLVQKGKDNPFAMTAMFGYARTMELRMRNGVKLGKDELEKIVELYHTIIENYPNTEFAAESYYNIAALYANELGDVDEAIEQYQKLLTTYSSMNIAASGGVRLGLLYLQQNQMDKAQETFTMVKGTFNSNTQARDEALFHLAHIAYYAGNLDSAKEQFGRLVINTNDDIANDALTMIALLEDNKEEAEQKALRDFAQAELKEFQKNFNGAIELYAKAAAAAPAAPLAERSFFRMGTLELNRNNNESARNYFTTLMQKYPQTIYGDEALLAIGDSYAAESNIPEAIKIYTELLEKYPRSTRLTEARLKIRKLRGDA